MSERGQWLARHDGRQVFITVHPSSLLRMDPTRQAAAYAQWVHELRQAMRGPLPLAQR
jgi:DNA polymerase